MPAALPPTRGSLPPLSSRSRNTPLAAPAHPTKTTLPSHLTDSPFASVPLQLLPPLALGCLGLPPDTRLGEHSPLPLPRLPVPSLRFAPTPADLPTLPSLSQTPKQNNPRLALHRQRLRPAPTQHARATPPWPARYSDLCQHSPLTLWTPSSLAPAPAGSPTPPWLAKPPKSDNHPISLYRLLLRFPRPTSAASGCPGHQTRRTLSPPTPPTPGCFASLPLLLICPLSLPCHNHPNRTILAPHSTVNRLAPPPSSCPRHSPSAGPLLRTMPTFSSPYEPPPCRRMPQLVASLPLG
jgi:hypothetical protein